MPLQTLSELKSNSAIIILAAGSSSRMGRSKQLLEIDKIPLLRKTVSTVLACNSEKIYVVIGSNADSHKTVIADLPVQIVLNEEWSKGMGSSLKKGLASAMSVSPGLAGVIVTVCDQPLLKSQHLNKIFLKYLETGKEIVASRYGGTAGVPTFFSKELFTELMNLQDQHGAKKIIERHPDQLEMVDFPGGEIDLDKIEDYYQFLKAHPKT
jgi:molybdenum cofactor cytidylyltransferase